ncbi:DMT family transporter [Aliiruegeria lutimaris]|uniref:Threonine/homoserine efflux transporter RhtA n=1 Tax=Aliiruegeria lutimaris TaxID=571298 RepID=A0A1G9M4R7_9RHOB|nr:DMT family transporter [Aliiruegeria lutimaris]SDL68927.1 Threonine/homoserine efflux transporter RhtA [Aliiruegeria lutimaris]
MRLIVLTTLTMVAFAANSVLNRLALADGAIGPAGFAAIRVGAGAAVLLVLLAFRDRGAPGLPRPTVPAVVGLAAYMLGFSFAYVSMDAGLGALILFGGVQVTMFFGALREGERPPAARWAGTAMALAGIGVLNWPAGSAAPPLQAALLMVAAAVGWGCYSLLGRAVRDPLRETTWNFVYCLPIVLLVLALFPGNMPRAEGVLLAVLSGGVTSALGYALWYMLLPQLGATRGALAQLSAPVLALAMGAGLLGETVTATALLAAALILGGVAVGLMPRAWARQKEPRG